MMRVCGSWITTSKYARRITGLTPFDLTGPAKGSKAVGWTNTVTRNVCELFWWTNIMEYGVVCGRKL